MVVCDVSLEIPKLIDGTAKKLNFLSNISSVNVTKSVASCGFSFTEEILNKKLNFVCIAVYHKEDYLVNVKLIKFAEILSNFWNLFKQKH